MSDRPANPYIGPRSFEERDGDRFFGRERELEELFHMLLARRLLLLHSPSGAGKSSLIQAKLIPRMRAEGFSVYPTVRLRGAPPEQVNRFVYATLLSLEEAHPAAERLNPAALASLNLAAYLDQQPTEGEELLVFDQFEELLSIDPSDREAKLVFITQLGRILENPRRWAIFAIREDYLGALRPFLTALPTRLAATYRLDLLSPDQARRSIQSPPSLRGGHFSDAAAQRLVDDLSRTTVQRPDGSSESVAGHTIEPVQLQVVCYRLWERKVEQQGGGSVTIELADIEAAGSVDDALAGYYAEQVAAAGHSAGVSERSIRDWVERELITEEGLRSQLLREPERTADMPNSAIQHLVQAHLLRAEERRGALWYELAHDRLVAPLRADNQRWRTANLSPLQRQAALWEEQRRPEGLLLRGDALQQAELDLQLRAQTQVLYGDVTPREGVPDSANEAALDDLERAFLAACRDARADAERERRQNRLIRRLSLAALAGLVVTLILAVVAWVQFIAANESASQARDAAAIAESEGAQALQAAELARTAEALAEERSRLAEAQSLAFAAQSQLEIDPQLALLLAYEAFVREPNPLTREVLPAALVAQSRRGPPLREMVGGPTRRPLVRVVNPPAASPSPEQERLVEITSVTFSPDGRFFVDGAIDGTVTLRDATTGQTLRTLRAHSDRVAAIAYSPDGTRIVTASYDGSAIIWDGNRSRALRRLEGHRDRIVGVAYSPDGRRIVTASVDATARIWDTASGQTLQILQGHGAEVVSATFSPDGTRVVTASWDGSAIVWDSATGQQRQLLAAHRDGVMSVAFSPDGTRIATASYDGTAIIWDAQTGQALRLLEGHVAGIASIVFSPNGSRLVTASDDGTARIWQTQSGQILRILEGYSGPLLGAIYAPDGRTILTASTSGELIFWEAELGLLARILRSDTATQATGYELPVAPLQAVDQMIGSSGNALLSAHFSPNGERVVGVASSGVALVWDATSSRILRTLQGRTIVSANFSADGQRLLTAAADGTWTTWSLLNDRPGRSLGGESAISSAAFSPDGRSIATTAYYAATIRDAATGALLHSLEAHSGGVVSAAFTADGQRIVTASVDGSAIIWEVAAGRALVKLDAHSGSVTSASFSPDGQRVVTTSTDRTAMIWDATTGQFLHTLRGHSSAVTSAAFSPDGGRIVTASADRTAMIWDTATGELLRTLRGHTGPVMSVTFSPDGQRLLTASADGSAIIWYAPDDTNAIQSALCRIWRNLTAEELQRYELRAPTTRPTRDSQCPPIYQWERLGA